MKAWQLMPPELQSAWRSIMEYNERLLGRPRPEGTVKPWEQPPKSPQTVAPRRAKRARARIAAERRSSRVTGVVMPLRSGNCDEGGARRAGQGRAAAKRTLDAPKHSRIIKRRSDGWSQPRMSLFTNRPTSGTFRNSPGLTTSPIGTACDRSVRMTCSRSR